MTSHTALREPRGVQGAPKVAHQAEEARERCCLADLLPWCHHSVPLGDGVATEGDGAGLKVGPCFHL